MFVPYRMRFQDELYRNLNTACHLNNSMNEEQTFALQSSEQLVQIAPCQFHRKFMKCRRLVVGGLSDRP